MANMVRAMALACLLALTQCAPPPVPYAQPANLTPQAAATIEGSDIPAHMSPGVFVGQRLVPEIKIKVSSVDHHPVGISASSDYLMTPGQHLVVLTAYYVVQPGSIFQLLTGTITLRQNFAAGKAYGVMSTEPDLVFGGFVRSKIWLEDSAGTQVTPLIIMTLPYSYSSD